MIRHKSILGLAFVLAFLAGTALAANVDGTWTWKSPGRGGEQEFSVTLKAEGENLTGEFDAGQFGKSQIKNGTVKGDEISFETAVEVQGRTISGKYNGKVEGDTIKGKTERQGGGGGGGGGAGGGAQGPQDWTATRKK